MATLNISLPEELKRRFFETFPQDNKSALIARLIAEAIDEAERKQRSDVAVDRILARHGKALVRRAGSARTTLEALRGGSGE